MIPALLDSDTISLLNKQHPIVSAHATAYVTRYDQLAFSELSYYEVTRGLKAVAATTRLAWYEQFYRIHRALPFTHDHAVAAADIWADLKRRGQLIGEIDLLIAATALSEGLAVATHNVAHFNRIPGLTVSDWTV